MRMLKVEDIFRVQRMLDIKESLDFRAVKYLLDRVNKTNTIRDQLVEIIVSVVEKPLSRNTDTVKVRFMTYVLVMFISIENRVIVEREQLMDLIINAYRNKGSKELIVAMMNELGVIV